MQRMQMPKSLQINMALASEFCNKHTYRKNGEDIVKPVPLVLFEGEKRCPRCFVEKQTEELTHLENEKDKEIEKMRNYNVLYNHSLLSDNTLLLASFDSFIAESVEEKTNKNQAWESCERLKNGEIFNVVIQGLPGAGKSHLAYSVVKELNETGHNPCLFISVENMIRKIKDSFSNRESKYTEDYFVELLSKVKILVLDDIGAETGAIDTDKTATNFVQRVLYAVTTARQDKTTIITTNLSSQSLFNMYDSKLVSRLLRRPKIIVFKETSDKRRISLPF